MIGINLGYSLTEQKVDLALGFETGSFTNDANGATVSEPDGMSTIMFAGRWWWDYSETAALIPNLSVNMVSDGAKMGSASMKLTTTDLKLGAGHNWWPADNALVIFDFGIDMSSTETDNGTSTSTDGWAAIPYWRVGAETKVFDWLDCRAGAERYWHSMLMDGDTPTEKTYGKVHTNTYLGASTHWNRLLFDLLIQPDFVQGGPYFISGNSSSMFTQVSMKYNFKK